MKKLCLLFILSLTVVLMTACSLEDITNFIKGSEEKVETNCTMEECMSKITLDSTVEEINERIGVTASEETSKYIWKFSSKENITLDTSSGILQANIDSEKRKNSKVDFSGVYDLRELLENGVSFTYEELVSKLNNVEGIINEKRVDTIRYIWVDKYGQVFSATFSLNTGKCTMITLK